tara:strand:+ start:3015 stop:3125 length:111 start_codon:yes stop_codon:yes gene_type:complete
MEEEPFGLDKSDFLKKLGMKIMTTLVALQGPFPSKL